MSKIIIKIGGSDVFGEFLLLLFPTYFLTPSHVRVKG